MAWLDPTDETDVGTAPDGRIYIDRAFCLRLLRENALAKLKFRLVVAFLILLGGAILFLILFSIASHPGENPSVRVVAYVLSGVFLFCFCLVLLSVARLARQFRQATNGEMSVETDQVTSLRESSMDYRPFRHEIDREIFLVTKPDPENPKYRLGYAGWHRPTTTIFFRNSKKVRIAYVNLPIEMINVGDTFYIVRAGKSTRSRRVDLCFDTRKYVWKD